jgi:peptide/nickel transport system substrate-binding protein
MKNSKKFIIGLGLLIFLVPFPLYATAQENINREDILWAAGYWSPPEHWNPAYNAGEAWGAFFMYLPMFDMNYQTNQLIPMIGKTMYWNEDGSELAVNINPEATWSDGVPITSQDVNWTFNFFYDMGQWNGAFTKRVENFNIINDTTFILEMKPEYNYSRDIYNRFIGYPKVLPQHIWDEIFISIDGFPLNDSADSWWKLDPWTSFKNDWLDPEFPEEWKVASGPYVPYYVSDIKDRQIYKKVDSWWADGVLFDNFDNMPTYIGQRQYSTNFAMNSAFADDEIDWYGGYYPRIWELLDDNSNVHAWTDQDPYFLPISGMIELVPNQRRYPFDQPWLRRALAYAINYEDLSDVSASGYLEKARIGWVDDRSPTQDQFYDPTIEATYGVEYDPSAAEDILAEHCLNIGGVWYTKNSTDKLGLDGARGDPVIDDYLGTLPDDPLTPENETALADEVNVKIGDYDIKVIYGWSDSMMQTTLLSTYFEGIGIKTSPLFVERGTFLNDGVQNGGSNFDLMLFGEGFAPANEIYIGLRKFVGAANNWANWSAWTKPEFADKLEELEISEPGTIQEYDVVYDMQVMLAQDMPSVPIAPNAYWYAYNERYWQGFPNELNPFIQPVSTWETANTGAMVTLLMNLSPSGDINEKIPGFGLGLLFLSALGAVIFSIYRIKKQKPK